MSVMPARRSIRGGPILCGPPTGLAEWRGMQWRKAPQCPNKATCYLAFSSNTAAGGWYLCDACAVLTIMWLEDTHENPYWARELCE